MAKKYLALVIGLAVAPFLAGYVNHDLQVFVIGMDFGIGATFFAFSIMLYKTLTKAGKQMKEFMEQMDNEEPKKASKKQKTP